MDQKAPEQNKRQGQRQEPNQRQGSSRQRGDRNRASESGEASEFYETVVHINRCAKVVSGGRRFSFSALVVTGNKKGTIGFGQGKAKEVPEAIRKGSEKARRDTFNVELRGNTIPHEVVGRADGAIVVLRPASKGTGLKAGGAVRAVLESAGISDVLSKSLGSNNKRALVNATVDGLLQLRSLQTIKSQRGVSFKFAEAAQS